MAGRISVRVPLSTSLGEHNVGLLGGALCPRWRNILPTPVQDNHLVLCDQNSLVKPDDFMIRDLYSYDEVGSGVMTAFLQCVQDNKYNYHIPQYVLHR